MMVAMALSIFMAGAGQAASLVLDGSILTVGIDESGGLVNLGTSQGIIYKPGPPNDFTYPGTPWEFYSLGVNGVSAVGGVAGSALNPIGVVTVDVSSATNLAAHTDSHSITLGGATIRYDQTVAFDIGSNVIQFKADLFNVGSTTAFNVVYARGLDPDQDVYSGSGFATNNFFPGPGSVIAIGPLTKLAIRIDAITAGGVTSIADLGWVTDPYVLAGGGLVGGAIAGNPNDYSINIAWLVGDILPGASVELDWTYTISRVPEPGILILLGMGLSAVGMLSRRIKL
jgi:hypothetical protein